MPLLLLHSALFFCFLSALCSRFLICTICFCHFVSDFPFLSFPFLQAGGKHYHPSCARCARCHMMFLEGEEMYLTGNQDIVC